MAYTMTVGLEIHIKLLTKGKVFCRCHNEQDFDSLPANTHVCPTCMGMPGALPSLDRECIQKAGAVGMLLGCTQQEHSFFDRKSYFYPDLPMGYQITQFTKPLNINGLVKYYTPDYTEEKQARILQAHLECDTAKTSHGEKTLLLDFNRAGTPLVEIVTAPTFHTADEVHGFILEIQRTMQYYQLSDAQMDKGQMRCDVNISVSSDENILGTKVEIKNMNSISSIKKAIAYEYTRQINMIEKQESIKQETRGWDEQKEVSYLMRSKENALDYRYFPEPDLPHVSYDASIQQESQQLIGEPIAAKIHRYKTLYGFHKEYINGLLSDAYITTLFEDTVAAGYDPRTVAKYIVNYILASSAGTLDVAHSGFSRESFLYFLESIRTHTIPDNVAKSIITEYLSTRKPIASLIDAALAVSTEKRDINEIIAQVLEKNAPVVAEYKGGKTTAIGFLIGQVMKETKGAAQPQEVQAHLEKILMQQ